eukprot:Gb_28316 [translate_table: standard]
MYLLNKSPSKAVQEDVTPQEKWSRRKPHVIHFRIFGSTTYTLIPEEKRGKLDAKCMKLLFVGYTENSKAYRLMNVTTNKMIIIDYEEIFAPMTKMVTIRSVTALVAQFGWKLFQMDIKRAFLNEDLKEEVYMDQLQGFQVAHGSSLVCKLKKVIYELKQTPRAWHIKIDQHLLEEKDESETFYNEIRDIIVKRWNKMTTSLHTLAYAMNPRFYHEDILSILGKKAPNRDKEVSNGYKKTFKKLYLDTKVACDVRMEFKIRMKLSAHYEEKQVDGTLYRQLVGSLIYLTATRPNIAYSIGMVSKFMTNPKQSH